MSILITTFSRAYPRYHARKGQATFFAEKILNSLSIDPFVKDYTDLLYKLNCTKEDNTKVCDQFLETIWDLDTPAGQPILNKHHTIRSGFRAKVGDHIKPCVWKLAGGRFAKGNQLIQFAPLLQLTSICTFGIDDCGFIEINNNTPELPEYHELLDQLANNDGLESQAFMNWFVTAPGFRNNQFHGQIRCWNPDIDYTKLIKSNL